MTNENELVERVARKLIIADTVRLIKDGLTVREIAKRLDRDTNAGRAYVRKTAYRNGLKFARVRGEYELRVR